MLHKARPGEPSCLQVQIRTLLYLKAEPQAGCHNDMLRAGEQPLLYRCQSFQVKFPGQLFNAHDPSEPDVCRTQVQRHFKSTLRVGSFLRCPP